MGIEPHVRQGGCKRARSVDALSLRIIACRRAALAPVPAVHHLLTLAAPAHLSHIIISYGPRNKGSVFDSQMLQLVHNRWRAMFTCSSGTQGSLGTLTTCINRPCRKGKECKGFAIPAVITHHQSAGNAQLLTRFHTRAAVLRDRRGRLKQGSLVSCPVKWRSRSKREYVKEYKKGDER